MMEKQEEDRFTLTWIIENYAIYHFVFDCESSKFTFNCLPGMEWTLSLRCYSTDAKLRLTGSDYVLENYKICSRCQLLTDNESLIVSLDQRIDELKNTQEVSLGSFQNDLVSRSIVNDILIIKCAFKLIKEANEEEIFPPLPYKNGLFSDVVLRTGDVSFNVHKAILCARWPNLAEKLAAENSSELVLDVKSNVLEAIIRYIYTGKMHFSEYEFFLEVSAAAVKYELPHLICTPTVAMTCREHASCVSKISFEWPIKNFSSLPIDTVLNSQIFAVNDGNPYGFITTYSGYLIFHICEDALFGRVFDISLCKVSEKIYSQESRVIVRSKISFDETNSVENEILFTVIENRQLAKFSRSISTDPEDLLLLKCELNFFMYPCVSPTIVESSNALASSVYCKCVKNDFNYLFKNKQMYPDVNITVGKIKIPAHKFILCARSSVFSRMFQTEMTETQNNCIKISDMDPFIVFQMLEFLYTGKFIFYDHKTTIKLYTEADKYKIPALKRKCSLRLKSLLSVKNICELLQFADLHSDDYLHDCVFEFISENAKEVFATEEWKKICENNMCAKLMMESIIRNNPATQFT